MTLKYKISAEITHHSLSSPLFLLDVVLVLSSCIISVFAIRVYFLVYRTVAL